MNTGFIMLGCLLLKAVSFHWERKPVRLTYWLKWSFGRLNFTCIPTTVQMFIKSGAAIAGQIEIDFFFFQNTE